MSNCAVYVRRAAIWISTAVVAIVVALALPVSQLRTVAVFKSCCCPDPSDCHCPDSAHAGQDAPAPDAPPTMRTCHSSERAVVAPQLSGFVAPSLVVVVAPVVLARAPRPPLAAPHPAPAPARPDAPS